MTIKTFFRIVLVLVIAYVALILTSLFADRIDDGGAAPIRQRPMNRSTS